MNLRIESEWVRANDVLSKQKKWERRRRSRSRKRQQEDERTRKPRSEEMTIDLVA